ncbi:putative transcription factor WD40-like family [Medicago truncatula]|uniref:Putative transcription factor WD40-like family n=1 Tax=Medicago truncatula TaxID=3880 RepID=A0A396JWH3_MEDTR|nr:putative transcription factor WD40-like family [Medicago truncatula]
MIYFQCSVFSVLKFLMIINTSHGSWVNSLALSTDYVLRTGAFDHTRKQFSSPEEIKKVALESYNTMRGGAPERLVSGSDDCTMYLWEPFSNNKSYKARMTGHQEVQIFLLFLCKTLKYVHEINQKDIFLQIATSYNLY